MTSFAYSAAGLIALNGLSVAMCFYLFYYNICYIFYAHSGSVYLTCIIRFFERIQLSCCVLIVSLYYVCKHSLICYGLSLLRELRKTSARSFFRRRCNKKF